jgi:signal transduction histidine kinase
MEDATRAGRALRIEIGDRLPDMPEDEPLSAALRRLAGAFEARSGVRAEVSTSPALDAPPLRVRRALLSIAGEALANASRHAAAGLVRVGLRDDAGGICLTIEDDGRGFSVDRDAPVPSGASYGLQIMRESARAAGARFEIESAPGRGTRISVRAPRAETPGR